MLNNRNRIEYLDIAKGIAILLVVLGHTCQISTIGIWIYSFHLPLFFFISGCILSLKDSNIDMKKSIKNRLKSLLLPYLGFSLIIFCLWFINTYLTGKITSNIVSNEIIAIITFKGIDALWFLPCLFFVEILFVISMKYIKKKEVILLMLVILSTLPFVNLGISHNEFYIQFMRILIGFVFLEVGYLSFKNIQSNKFNIIFFIGLIIINVILGRYNKQVDLYSLNLNNYFLYYGSAFSGILAILLMCKEMVNVKTISFLGKNSLIIMAIHIQIIIIVSKLISVTTKHDNVYIANNLYFSLLVFFLTVLILVPLIKIINKYFYFLLGKKQVDSIKKRSNNSA
ncbi:acyltransferase family protein [Bacillus sp. OTU2372]|uniref:acyltransferase family protein n=1 Tax=Bacillus sp. OTU2372 TaxID=3043858 RepID=UPI00313A7E0F